MGVRAGKMGVLPSARWSLWKTAEVAFRGARRRWQSPRCTGLCAPVNVHRNCGTWNIRESGGRQESQMDPQMTRRWE